MSVIRGKGALVRNIKARGIADRQPCAYSHRPCSQSRLENFEFCMKHILEDKTSPYKQCSYTAPKTSRRCTNAAPKSDRKEGFCLEHAKRVVLSRQRASRKRRPKETAETLLDELAASTAAATDTCSDTKRVRRLVDSVATKALEYGSSSDSDTEVPSVDQAWRRDNDSDAESIDSEQEDPLKHAGVYSQEEAALLLRDKYIRLQSLYIEQFKRLQHVLKEKRRKFLHTYKQEREMLGPIQAYKQDPSQRRKYEQLQAMKRYHKFYGKEALLHQKCNLRRKAVAEGVHHRPPVFSRCIASTPDGRCNKRVVPLSKFCMAHILRDPKQVLFEPCSFRKGKCGEAVVNLDSAPLCRRHYSATIGPSSVATESQTEEPVEVKDEFADIKIEVDDFTTHSLSAFPTSDKPPAAIFDTSDSVSGKEEDEEQSAELCSLPGDRLNSSGEGALDIGEMDVNMEEEELMELMGGELLSTITDELD